MLSINKGDFVTVVAINQAIERCVTLEGLKEIDEKSLSLLSNSSYADRARVYEYMNNRWSLIIDAAGEGPYAEERKTLLDVFR